MTYAQFADEVRLLAYCEGSEGLPDPALFALLSIADDYETREGLIVL